jgi:hypothetical protein
MAAELNPDPVFRRTVTTASEMLWALDAAEDCLAALHDVLDAATRKAELRAARMAEESG